MQNKKNIGVITSVATITAAVLLLAGAGRQPVQLQGDLLLWREACHQVLDDPSTVNRYAFRTYHQYVNYCVERKIRDGDTGYTRTRVA